MSDAVAQVPFWSSLLPRKERSMSQPQPSFITLLERLRQGEEAAMELLIEDTQAAAYRLAYSIVQDRDRCQDVLQDVYWTVYQKNHQLRELSAFRGWFTRILVHRAQAELRQRMVFLDDLPESDGLFQPAPALEDQWSMQEALQGLVASDRTILTLREIWDMPYQEIAEALEIPLGTVASRIFKARQRLLAQLSKGDQPR